MTLSILSKLPTTRHFGRPFCLTLNYLNILSIEHSHSNLPNSKPILGSIHMTKFQVLKKQKIGHAIRPSISEKPILAKLVKSLIN